MSHPPAVVVDGLGKDYRTVTAVQDVTFSVAAGEVFGLLGPNGAGKTTVVEILAGLRMRTRGAVAVLGEDPASAPRRWRSRIGVVTQSAGDHDGWRAAELLAGLASCYPDPLTPAEALERVGLADAGGALLRTLSGGMRRRLDVAAAIVGRPELLFLDEPTTGFDPEARRDFWQLIRDLAGAGTTILLTTHYLDEAEALADRVLVVQEGRVRALSAPDQLGGPGETVVSWNDAAGHHSVTTQDSRTLVRELVTAGGVDVGALQVRPLTLEDRYLKLIGEPS